MKKHGYTAWGQTRLLNDWKRDPRVASDLSYSTMCKRLRAGWSVEDALTTPVRSHHKRTLDGKPLHQWSLETNKAESTLRGRLRRGEQHVLTKPLYARSDHQITAWGETKTWWEWLEDPRTSRDVTATMFKARKHGGWSMEEALSTPRMRRQKQPAQKTR